MSKIEDNPVPSIEKNIIILLKTLHAFNQLNNRIVSSIGQSFNIDTEKICKEEGIIYNILQNGVETDKEQPKHVYSLQNFGHIDDICPDCQSRIQINRICDCPDTLM